MARQGVLEDMVRHGHGATVRTGKLVVDLDKRVATVGGQPVSLTAKEYGVLELLSLRKGMILTKEIFLNHLYGETNEPEPKISDVFICKLRKKLARATGRSHYIETVWGRGYVMREQPTESAGESGSASTTATLEGTSFSDGDCITAVSHSLSGLSSPGDRRT